MFYSFWKCCDVTVEFDHCINMTKLVMQFCSKMSKTNILACQFFFWHASTFNNTFQTLYINYLPVSIAHHHASARSSVVKQKRGAEVPSEIWSFVNARSCRSWNKYDPQWMWFNDKWCMLVSTKKLLTFLKNMICYEVSWKKIWHATISILKKIEFVSKNKNELMKSRSRYQKYLESCSFEAGWEREREEKGGKSFWNVAPSEIGETLELDENCFLFFEINLFSHV